MWKLESLSLPLVGLSFVLLSHIALTDASEDKCRNDCNLPINYTHAEWSMYEAGPRYIYTSGCLASILFFFVFLFSSLVY